MKDPKSKINSSIQEAKNQIIRFKCKEFPIKESTLHINISHFILSDLKQKMVSNIENN